MASDPAAGSVKPVLSSRRSEWLFALALLAVTLVAYRPAWFGKPIWDDDAHMTSPQLRSWTGLWRIWTEPGATQQYYPLVHSAFWLEHKIWGDSTPGYHLVNILLHVSCAFLLLKILRLLDVPGAWLAAAIFALHPIEVESVAWISELKNTLSGVFYLGAALAFLHFDRDRERRLYVGALGLFLAGLLCKTVIATLPGALLVVFWWKRGRLSWKRDAWPLVPFFGAGIAMGLLTAHVEQKYVINTAGSALQFTAAQRCLIAGRALWFYIVKLLWPAKLIFIYPRWTLNTGAWWQWLFPIAALALTAILWARRKQARAPLAAALFFAGTLFPALGFVNVYPFMFSFVADHFQYLAGIGVIALASAGADLWFRRMEESRKWMGPWLAAGLLLMLAGLTWRRSGIYADANALYSNTVARNPECWMAYNNLGIDLQERGDLNKAIACFQKAIAIKTDYAEAHSNLGYALHLQGRVDDAISEYQLALNFAPNMVETHLNLAIAFLQKNEMNKALLHFQRAVEIAPDSAKAQNDLGLFLLQNAAADEAIAHLQKAVDIDPANAEAHENFGLALLQKGRSHEAADEFRKALEIKPDYAEARHYLDSLQQDGTSR